MLTSLGVRKNLVIPGRYIFFESLLKTSGANADPQFHRGCD